MTEASLRPEAGFTTDPSGFRRRHGAALHRMAWLSAFDNECSSREPEIAEACRFDAFIRDRRVAVGVLFGAFIARPEASSGAIILTMASARSMIFEARNDFH